MYIKFLVAMTTDHVSAQNMKCQHVKHMTLARGSISFLQVSWPVKLSRLDFVRTAQSRDTDRWGAVLFPHIFLSSY